MNNLEKFSVIYLIVISIFCVNCQRRQFDPSPELPTHLPAPPKKDKTPPPPPSNNTGGEGSPPVPPPQDAPFGPLGPGLVPGQFVPFGLNHIILIIVPMFKYKFLDKHGWFTSTLKISMPITVFFDQLKVPPEMLAAGIAGLPLPLGFPPPAPPPGVGPLPPPSAMSPIPPTTGGSPITNVQTSTGYGHYYHKKPYIYGNGYDADPYDPNSEDYNEIYTGDEEMEKRRRKREILDDRHFHISDIKKKPHGFHHSNFRQKRAIDFNKTLHFAERASLIRRLENILESTGFGGKSCLLRAVCEVHEAPLNHYGLMGELVTMFFSISRSIFAKSHLPEYLHAESVGRHGNCTEFFTDCETTMFYWEERLEKIPHINDI